MKSKIGKAAIKNVYYKVAVAEITNFVRGTCKGSHFSGSGFTKAIYSFPKYWIPLQALVRIVPSFQEYLFHKESFIMTASEFDYLWTEGG